MRKLIIRITYSLFLIPVIGTAQIAINNSAANPDASAILDLNTGNTGVNKGFLAPQVALTNVSIAAPVTTPASGLMVYSSTAPTGGNGIGYYYWTGTKWDGLGTSPALLNLTQGTGITAFSYNGSSAATVGLANTGVTAGSYGSATTVPTYTVNAQGQITGAANVTITSSSGTVTSFSSGNLSPLFTTSVANSTTTPALTYSLSKAAGYTILGNNTGASAVPTYFAPDLTSALFANQGYVYSVLHGDGSGNLYWSGVDLTTDITNNLPVTNLNSGSGASSSTFWRGDGTWATPSGGSISGSGTNGYLALWTPNSTTLGTSVVQDDGTEVGVGTAPSAGVMLNVFTTTGNAIYASSNDASASGISAYDASGIGVTGASSNNYGVQASSVNSYGLYASSTNADGIEGVGGITGVYGYSTDPLGGGDGVEGVSDNGDGVYGYSLYQVGVEGDGGTLGGLFEDHSGELSEICVSGAGAGGYFSDNGGDYAYIAQAGSAIVSNVPKSTEIKDKNNNERMMFCNESPEVKFEDYGEGQLVNGRVHIALDSLLAMNICINEKHPLEAFIQLEGNCNGVYVTNKTATGFDVIELNYGTSNTPFSWHIVCNRANEPGQYHNFADKRFPVGPGALKKPEIKLQKGIGAAPATPAQNTPATKKAAN